MVKNKKPLTQSMLKCYNWCPKKYYYEYIMNIVLARLYSPFLIGEGIHIGILYLLIKKKKYKKAIRLAKKIMNYRKDEYEKNRVTSVYEDQEFIYQSICAESIIANYYKYHKNFIKKIKIISSEKIIQTNIDLPGNFILTAKVDGIIKFDEKKYVYELKTVKSASHSYIMSNYFQFLHYYFVTKKEKKNIKGIYIDGIKKPSIKLKQNESEEDFMSRLSEIYKSSDNYYHDIIRPPRKHVKQYYNNMMKTAYRITESTKTNFFECKRDMCRIYGDCAYLLLCDKGVNPMTLMKYREKTTTNEELEVL
ncbi:MAG TPA: hypothetical protein ENG87_06010 [Candidatus Pacearchaeota archaeon]|nr:hypothetical protein [Candidatus Pacearchaeota archaeon]